MLTTATFITVVTTALLRAVPPTMDGGGSASRGGSPKMQQTAVKPVGQFRPSSTPGGTSTLFSKFTRDSAVNDDAMRWYLSSIGKRRLLDNTEEVQLATAVKELLRWKATRRDLMEELQRRPTRKLRRFPRRGVGRGAQRALHGRRAEGGFVCQAVEPRIYRRDARRRVVEEPVGQVGHPQQIDACDE